METPKDIGEAVRLALNNEVRGKTLYDELSEKAKNGVTKKVFAYVAGQELLHIEKIKELAGLLGHMVANFDFERRARSLTKEQLKELFGKSIAQLKAETKPDENDMDAYRKAMQMEQDAYDLYTDMASMAEDGKVTEFFGILMKEENEHYLLFKKSLEFIENPEAWYAEEEGWLLEG